VYTFEVVDRRTLRDDLDSNYWHGTDFQAINGGLDAPCMWCGGFNDRCNSWELTTGGYGPYWNQVMQLDLPGTYNVANGCSIQFKTRYVMECNYDYAYLEFYSFSSEVWRTIDFFNGKGGCTGFFAPCKADWNNYPKHDKCITSEWGVPVNYPGQWKGEGNAPRVFPEYPYGGGAGGDDYVIVRGDSMDVNPLAARIRLRWRVKTDQGLSTSDGNANVKGWWIDDLQVRWAGGSYVEDFNGVPEGGLPTDPPWSFPRNTPVYDGFRIRYDLDPPFEGYFLPSPGDSGIPSACDVNASWQWSVTSEDSPLPEPDPESPLPGYHVMVYTPAIPVNYGDEEGGPFPKPGAVFQKDAFMNMLPETCDYTDTWVRVHLAPSPTLPSPWNLTGAWCAWNNIDGYITFGGGTFWNIDENEDVSAWTAVTGVDSVQYSFLSLDVGDLGEACWDPTLPPHKDSQYCVDNLSVGMIDGSGTTFTTEARSGRFQDTFNIHTCMHSPNLANNDIRYDQYILFDLSESLNLEIRDPDGLSPGNVELWWSYDGFITPQPAIDMNLSVPYPQDPSQGGTFRTTICDTPWVAGTEIEYFVKATDDSGNVSYYPAESDPADPDFPEYFTVSILPTPGAKILFVDDFGRNRRDYHPCRNETTTQGVEDFYTDILEDLGYGYMQSGGYDKYDVGAASSNQRINEAWGFWVASPDSPDVGFRAYEHVIWTCGPYFDENTIQDTTATFLKQFVFNGGNLWMSGDRIGQDLNDPETSTDPQFYPYVLAASFNGEGPSAFLDSDQFPKSPGLVNGPWLPTGDSLHMYGGCDIPRPAMDRITINYPGAGDPTWYTPGPYLIYEDATAPYDSVAAIYNFITFGPDTGKVVYTPFSLEAVVDSTSQACDPPPGTAGGVRGDVGFGIFHGRANLVRDIMRFFDEPINVPQVSVPDRAGKLVNALYPAQPNPFNPETNISFSLAAHGEVSLVVYDVMGRRVRTLVDGVREAGPQTILWDGRNDAGHLVSSGLYFARMETTGFTASQKLTLLK
jgi:hypothetical protein